MKKYMTYGGRKFAAGGAMPMEQLTEFNEGGRHEENSLGGIPQGMNPAGQMNLVEEGETKFDAENYIYSDSLKVDKELAEAFNLSPKMVGKTFADASKMAGRKKSKREGDAIEEAANNADLENLMEAQEAFKQARIEEKLQEIAELDPNALPALMGQGQPQGGPAMGGQMQEAPIDEQAMMEQQMMAEQQAGGGQPSPEEMAMMQQQQDMMMGQQEGMMRSGGKLPKEVLKARVQSHMSPAEADAYVKNYAGGGYMTRSYNPGGFMGMNMANAGMMTPGPCGTPGNPPCPGKETEFSKTTMDRMEDRATQNESASAIGSLPFSPHLSYDEREGFEENRALQDIRKHMLSNYGAAATDGDPAYGNGVGEIDAEFPEINFPKINFPGKEKRENIRDFRQKPNTAGRRYTKVNRLLNPFRASDNRIKNTGNQYFAVKHPRATEDAEGNSLRGLSNLYLGVKDKSKFVGRFGEGKIGRGGPRFREFGGNLMQSGQEAGLNPMQGISQFMRKGGKMCYGCGGAMHNYGGRMYGMNQMATGGEIISGIGSGLYGIGEGLLDTLTFGLTDELTDRGYEALQEIGPMKGEDNIGDAIRGGANAVGAAGGAVLTGGAATGSAVAQGSKGTGDMLGAIGEETGNETLGKVGKGVEGAGQVAGMFIGGGGAGSAAGKAAEGAGTVAAGAGTLGAGAKVADAAKTAEAASKAAKAAKFAKVGEIASNKAVQAGVNMASTAIGSAEEKAEAERLAEEERMRVEREMMMTNDPNSMYYDSINQPINMATAGTGMMANGGYMGTRSYGTGGRPGLWANIHAKRARIAAGSGERMRKPGSKGAPTAKALKNSQNAMGGRMYYSGGYLFGPAGQVPEQTNTDNEFNNMYPDISEALEQTPMQQIAMYAPIAKNIYDATLAKSDDYTPDFVPAEFVQLDSAQAIQQAKQSNAGIVNAAKAKGFNNPSVMLALNQQLQGTVANVQAQYDQVNAKLKQAKLDKDNTQKTELSKIKQELAMRLKEAKNAAANEALKQAKQIAENKTANELAVLYATMGAPDMGQYFLGNKKMTKAEINKAIIRARKRKEKIRK